MSRITFEAIAALPVPKELAYSQSSWEIWQRAGCACEYCGQNMFESPLIFRCCAYDHILPWHKYRGDPLVYETKYLFRRRSVDTSNFALSCKLCNDLKGSFDPNQPDGLPKVYERGAGSISESQRSELIDRCGKYVSLRREKWDSMFKTYRSAICSDFSLPHELT